MNTLEGNLLLQVPKEHDDVLGGGGVGNPPQLHAVLFASLEALQLRVGSDLQPKDTAEVLLLVASAGSREDLQRKFGFL